MTEEEDEDEEEEEEEDDTHHQNLIKKFFAGVTRAVKIGHRCDQQLVVVPSLLSCQSCLRILLDRLH